MKRRDMAHPMTYDCLPYELERHATGEPVPHAHPMTFEEQWGPLKDPSEPSPLAYWAVAIAGGLAAASVVWLVIVAAIAVLGR